jgi:hypothetical protein
VAECLSRKDEAELKPQYCPPLLLPKKVIFIEVESTVVVIRGGVWVGCMKKDKLMGAKLQLHKRNKF